MNTTPDTWDWTETLWVILRGMSTEKKNEVMNLISLILQEKTQRDIEIGESLKVECTQHSAGVECYGYDEQFNKAIEVYQAALKETK